MCKSSKNSKEGRAGLPPVQSIELSEKNKRIRIILAVAAAVLALVMFGIFFTNLLSKEPGWQRIQTDSAVNSCSGDFMLQYYLGGRGVSATAEHKQLKSIYTDATKEAYRVFHEDLIEDGLGNLAQINRNPNQIVTVEPALFDCLTKIHTSGNRTIYLANVNVEYRAVFNAQSEWEANQYDPTQQESLAEFVQELASYANDPQHVNLELLGDRQVRLNVSQEYASFATTNELDRYLDLGWLKNAFIADYLAQKLTEAGYTHGYLVSVDGFTRNLDSGDDTYSINFFDRIGLDIYMPAQMTYRGALSLVSLRNFPQLEEDRLRCFAFSDGHVVSTYIDPADGMSKSSTDAILAYSKTASCADIALSLSSVFIAEEFDRTALLSLSNQGISSIWCEDSKLCYSDKAVDLKLTDDHYTAHHMTK